MPQDSVSLTNGALLLIGQQQITSVDDTSKRAVLAKVILDDVRDEVLKSGSWNEATKRAVLAESSTAPVWGFSSAFPLPADFLKLLRSNMGSANDWRIEGNSIVTDLSSVSIVYIYRMTDYHMMSGLLYSCIKYKLAADLSKPITGSNTVKRDMDSLYEHELAKGRFHDANQGPIDRLEGSTWLASRLGTVASGSVEEKLK